GAPAHAGGARSAGEAHAEGPASRSAGGELRGPVAEPARPRRHLAAAAHLPGLRRSAAPGDAPRSGAPVRLDRPRRPQHRRAVERRLHLRERAAGQTLRHPQHHGQSVPESDARPRYGRAQGAARQGRVPRHHGKAGAHVAGDARQVDHGQRARHEPAEPAARRAAAAAASVRPEREGTDDAPEDGAAPGALRLHAVPSSDGSDRLRARELRRHRAVAQHRREPAGRSEVDRLRQHAGERTHEPARVDPEDLLAPVRRGRGGEAARVRAWPRRGIPGHAARALHRARGGRERRPVLGAGAQRRQEPPVPDEYEDRAGAGGQYRVDRPHRVAQGSQLAMFITKKHIPRRTFLQGAGVTLALPLLESMVPAATALAQTAAAPTPRFVGMFFPHGMAPGYWEPKEEGKLPEKLPYILESLEKYKEQTTVMSGLWSQSAEPPEGTTGSDHWVAAAYLTGIKPRKTAG